MEFLGIGPQELLYIVLIAILIIGPKDIGKTARTVGQTLNRLYKSEAWKTLLIASREVRNLPNRLAQEAELEELRELARVDLGPGASPAAQASASPEIPPPGPLLKSNNRASETEEPANLRTRLEDSDPELEAWVRPRENDGSPTRPIN